MRFPPWKERLSIKCLKVPKQEPYLDLETGDTTVTVNDKGRSLCKGEHRSAKKA